MQCNIYLKLSRSLLSLWVAKFSAQHEELKNHSFHLYCTECNLLQNKSWQNCVKSCTRWVVTVCAAPRHSPTREQGASVAEIFNSSLQLSHSEDSFANSWSRKDDHARNEQGQRGNRKAFKGTLPQNIFILISGHKGQINSLNIGGLNKLFNIFGRKCNLSYLLVLETMSPLDVRSKVCMATNILGVLRVDGASHWSICDRMPDV